MQATVRAVIIAAVLILSVGFGQPQPNSPVKTVRVSGVITDSEGAPMAGKSLEFQDLTVLYETHEAKASLNSLTTTSDGGVVVAIRANDEYAFVVIDPDYPNPSDPVFLNVSQFVVAGEQDIDFGKIVLKSRTKDTHGGALIGPVTVTSGPVPANSRPTSTALVSANRNRGPVSRFPSP